MPNFGSSYKSFSQTEPQFLFEDIFIISKNQNGTLSCNLHQCVPLSITVFLYKENFNTAIGP